jgi:hypothetical protein
MTIDPSASRSRLTPRYPEAKFKFNRLEVLTLAVEYLKGKSFFTYALSAESSFLD